MSGKGTPKQIPFMRLDRQFALIREAAMPAILSVLEKGRVLQGPEIEQLEARLAHMHELKHCIAVNSGTDALIFSIACLGLPEGSRIAVPTMTFVASASAILHNRCQPVFVDVDPDTMLMDKVALLELIRRHEIDAVMAVHLYGQMLDLEEISYEARQQGIALIEDAAQVLGSSRSGRPAGVYCDITCLSFDPTKVVGAYGSGGALLTNDDGLAEKARLLRYHGHTGNSVYKHPGFNSQMDTLQATIINVKLNYLDQWQARRCKIAAYFAEGLTQTPYVQLLKTLPGNVHNCHKFVICVQGRDRIQRHLATRGIQTKIHYPLPLHLQPCFGNGAKSPSLPHAEQSAKAVLSLPMYPELADEEADYIVACILEAYEDR